MNMGEIVEKIKTKDAATGELLRISQEAIDMDVREASKEALLEAYSVPRTFVDRKNATKEIVAYHEGRLGQSKDVLMKAEKTQEQMFGIKEDFIRTLEKELKLSTIQTIIASVGSVVLFLMLFNLITGGIVSKFKK